MADIAVEYALATPGGTVTFNDGIFGHNDQLAIQRISGLAGPPVRAPIDDVAFGDGGLVHNFWKGPRHIIVEGVMLVVSTRVQDDIVEIRNDFEEDLRVALESILQADGTLTWTPQGQLERQLTVRHDVQLECDHDQNFLLSTFSFGLVAADPDWTEST